MVPREPPVVPDPATEEKTKRKGALELALPPREDITGLELDEQLIVHSYNTAIAGIFHLVRSACYYMYMYNVNYMYMFGPLYMYMSCTNYILHAGSALIKWCSHSVGNFVHWLVHC